MDMLFHHVLWLFSLCISTALKNSADWFVVTVEVKDDTGSVIAAKTVTKTGTVDIYTQEIIKLEYEVLKKAAVLSIVF